MKGGIEDGIEDKEDEDVNTKKMSNGEEIDQKEERNKTEDRRQRKENDNWKVKKEDDAKEKGSGEDARKGRGRRY